MQIENQQVMNSANESNQLEMPPKPLESVFASLAKAHPMAWAVLALLVMNMAGAMPFWGVVVGGVFAALLFYRMDRMEEIKVARAIAAAYANCNGPIVVGSEMPEETVQQVHERAEKWRQRLRECGNPTAAKTLVIEFPYQPVLTPYDQLATGWQQYLYQLGQKRFEENMRFYNSTTDNELKRQFASFVFQAPKQEQQQ